MIGPKPMTRAVAAVIAAASLARLAAAGGPQFEDATAAAGVDALHHATYLVTGQAWGDYDGDGVLDLYLTDSNGASTLYRGNGDGTFSVSPLAGVVALPAEESGGAVFADYDNDGWRDLYALTRDGDYLFHNDGGAGFTDVTAAAGLGQLGQGESATWGDYDDDGFLDLYVVNWYYQDNEFSPNSRDLLFHNNGDGTFTDVSSSLDTARLRGPGFAATMMDFDNDGDRDIYVVNDKHWGNLLWRNDGPGCGHWCFTDVSVSSGAHRPVWGMGIATGDYDEDGDLDFYFSSIGEQVLLQNQTAQGSPTFVEVTDAAGVNVAGIGWGMVFFDYDNDGWLDLYLSNMALPNSLWHNEGDGTFSDASAGGGADNPGPSIGVAKGDYDNDGQLDLVVGNYDNAYYLYRNLGTPGNHWLLLDLEGRGPVNRDALGTRVYLETSDGRTLMREHCSDSSLGAGNELVLHFGLGAATIDALTVVWPDGLVHNPPAPPVDSRRTLVYPAIFSDGFESGDLSAWTVP